MEEIDKVLEREDLKREHKPAILARTHDVSMVAKAKQDDRGGKRLTILPALKFSPKKSSTTAKSPLTWAPRCLLENP
jgi:hypothetical protein